MTDFKPFSLLYKWIIITREDRVFGDVLLDVEGRFSQIPIGVQSTTQILPDFGCHLLS